MLTPLDGGVLWVFPDAELRKIEAPLLAAQENQHGQTPKNYLAHRFHIQPSFRTTG